MAEKYFQLSQSGQQVQNLLNDVPNKAPLASPALTGTPTTPTPAAADNSTKIANTAFVNTYVGNELTAYNATIAPQIAAKQDAAVTLSVILTAAGWSGGTQTVTATGVTSSNLVFVAPRPLNQLAYSEAQIVCTAQGTNSLTFTCQNTPVGNITVYVVIF